MKKAWRFFSDTNQALFTDHLDRADLSYRVVQFVVTVNDPPEDLDEKAEDLGGLLSHIEVF
jgi:hypothetical protein